jgi:hypothetical protein
MPQYDILEVGMTIPAMTRDGGTETVTVEFVD